MSKEDITEILERLARIEARLENGLCEDMKDHERRLRWLEKGFWMGLGALALIQTILRFIPIPWGGH